MPQRYLFERLAGIEAEDFDTRRAAAEQLQRLLCTLPVEEPDASLSEGPHLLNLGLPSVVDLGFMDSVELGLMAEHLSAQLHAFEPRLASPDVRFGPGPSAEQSIELQIQAKLDAGQEDEIIRFTLNRDGLRETAPVTPPRAKPQATGAR